MGQLDKAEAHTQECVKIRTEAFGEGHPDTLVALSNLGAIQLRRGKHDAGIETLERVLKLQEEKLGPKHPQLLVLLNNLASAHRSKGNYERAEELIERTLEITEPLGEGHPDLARSRESLALLQLSRGDGEKALATRRETLSQLERVAGRDHPSTIEVLTATADTLLKLERNEEAKELYLDAQARLGDRTHTQPAARVHLALAEVALRSDDEALAREELESAVEIFDELSAEDLDAANARFNLAKRIYDTDRERSLKLIRAVVKALADVEDDHELKTEVRTWVEENNVDIPLTPSG
jgi:tetratricopeptide (TPR) repeat protein